MTVPAVGSGESSFSPHNLLFSSSPWSEAVGSDWLSGPFPARAMVTMMLKKVMEVLFLSIGGINDVG